MDAAIEAIEVTTIFGNTDHAFMSAIKGCVEHGELVFSGSFHLNLAQYLIPRIARLFEEQPKVEPTDFALQIATRLNLVDVGDAITHAYLSLTITKRGHKAIVPVYFVGSNTFRNFRKL